MRQWYLVHPKGKELSLVAQAFLNYALEIEPRMRERMESLWPKLSKCFKSVKKTSVPARRRKKS